MSSSLIDIAPGRYAAIDIGTVTCRMLVADVLPDGSIKELDKEYEITNLGEGVDATGFLKPEAIERTVAAVARYCAVRDALGSNIPTIAMATSASRDAQNVQLFVSSLAKLGVELSVIPGGEEAQLSFAGASSDFAGERLLVSDIGGGSTELVLGVGGDAPSWMHSFNVGCRRVTEKFLHSDPPATCELAQARAWVRAELGPLFSQGLEAAGAPERLVAVAGTATTVVSVRDKMATYDSAKVHGQLVTRAQLDEVFERLAAMPVEQRQQVVGLDPKRAAVIVAGFMVLQELLDLAGMGGFTVSEHDILHGMLLRVAQGTSF